MFKNARFAVATAVLAAFALPVAAQTAPIATPVQPSAPAANNANYAATDVVASVNGTDITLGHVIALRQQLPQQFAQVPDATLYPAIVQQLIEQELLAQAHVDQLTNGEQLMLQNETRSFIANAALQQAANAAITDAAVQAAYTAYATAYAQQPPVTEYHAAHILVRDEATRDEVVAALAAGQDFADVARQYSIDGSKQQGGDLGWFAAGTMIPDFQTAVEALQPGQVSDPVHTQYGWHVIKLFETRVQAVPPLEQVRDQLVQQIQRDATRALIDSLRAAATVTDNSAGIDPSVLSQTQLLDE